MWIRLPEFRFSLLRRNIFGLFLDYVLKFLLYVLVENTLSFT